MGLSKQEESEIIDIYWTYFDNYIKGDVKGIASLLDEGYTQIGSAESEVFFNKQEALQFLYDTIDQVKDKADIRNRSIKCRQLENFVLVIDLWDMYVLVDNDWAFYSKFRATTLMEKIGDQWKFVYQHSSMPDLRVQEGDNIAIEKITKENLELRDAVKRRTVELEQKNRELAMEAALERVRAVAIGMRKPDDLPGICEVLFNELRSMGFTELRNTMINIHNDEKSTFVNYDYSDEIGKSINHLNYTIHPVIEKQIKQIRSTHDAFSETVFSGQDLADWKAFRKRIGEKDDPRIDNVSALYYYFCSIGTGAIGISTFGPISAEKLAHLKRFRNVFEFAYRRYMDVAQAEAQAREAEIELSLERVRAVAMAMRQSAELTKLIFVLYQELTKLDANLDRCFIMIVNPENKGITWWMSGKEGLLAENGFFIPMNQHASHLWYLDCWKKRKKKWQYLLEGKEKKDCDRFLFNKTELARLPEFIKNDMAGVKQIHLSGSSDQFGSLVTGSLEPLPDEQQDIISRFTIAFNQSYTRFLDLQKAEAQAREAQIELGLERVRARAMAMQKSNELSELVDTVFKELTKLDFALNWCIINIIDESSMSNTVWAANPDINEAPESYHMLFEDYPFHDAMMKGWKERKTKRVYVLEGEEKKAYDEYLFNDTEFRRVPAAAQAASRAMEKYVVTFTFSNFGGLQTVGEVPLSDTNIDILSRFGKVFDLTYTRFNDLQKAEAQAKEAQIETALERVRSRTMGMQKSEELKQVIQVVFEQFDHINIKIEHTGFVIDYKARDDYNIWIADPLGVPSEVTIPYFDSVYYNQFNEAKEKGWDFFATNLGFEEKNRFYQKLFEYIPGLPVQSKEFYFSCPGLAASTVLLDNVGLYIENFSGIPYTEEENNTLMRFGRVFEQAYIRFLDLQRAEAQAREAQIEAALERVRSRTMGMQHSNELQDTALLLFQQILSLDVSQLGCGFNIWEEDRNAFTSWMGGGLGENTLVPAFKVPSSDDIFLHIREAAEKGELLFVSEQSGEELETHYKYMFSLPVWKDLMAGWTPPTFQVMHCAFFSQGFLMFISREPVPQAHDIFKRFAKVFEQTYTRFLDLQKAEAQAREAKIEAALEKVRGRTMAMQRSDELPDTALLLSKKVEELGVQLWGTSFQLWEEGRKEVTVWACVKDMMIPPFKVLTTEDTLYIDFSDAAVKGESLYVKELGGEALENHIQYMMTIRGFREGYLSVIDLGIIQPESNIFHAAYFSNGFILFITLKPCPEAHDIFKRFAKVFEQTYTRFLDLQKAEAQAIEAVKRASVDRVRAEIASMRTTSDLERITPLIWNELTTLNIPFIRCGIFIMDEEQQQVHTFLSTPEGKSIAAFHQPYNTPGEIAQIVKHWNKKKMYRQHWDEARFIEFTKDLVEQGAITSGEKYLTENRPTNLYLHFLPFLQGMLYVGNTDPLSDDALQLVQNLADAFSTAYARYEDFNRLEAAKEQVDKTLTDLKQAQSQLVQAEKMASLGELTAGIAHEIQNPLNFVNNFSEINTELSDEIVEAAKKGDLDEIIQLAADIKSNQDKISEHGKRADAIVKGMLQHSRSSSGIKEPTDINKLADEYFRLSYHGLRAKDNTFNATMQTDFDPAIGEIPIMPQDIGRVLLNLYNNAFYAVSERMKSAPNGYEPQVTVSTRLVPASENSTIRQFANSLIISVKDNGMGIPKKVLDKIFQPFFTTKPTGQGTGLGLSLSYDIVKAHGGELRVETMEGEGSEFVIQLPIV